MNQFLLELLFLGAIVSSILVITSKNPVISVLFLIVLFINVAGYLILSDITFLGLAYILVYIGAIAVLFLFVIMMINIKLVDILELGSEYTKNLPLALMVGVIFIYEIITISNNTYNNINLLPIEYLTFLNKWITSNSHNIDGLLSLNTHSVLNTFHEYTHIEMLGQGLYTYGAIFLILSSLILLLSMIAPIILSTYYTAQNDDSSSSNTPQMGE